MTQPKLKRGDVVRIAPDGTFGVLTSLQEVHDRYQLLGISGWQYGLDKLEKSNAEALLEENKRLKDDLVRVESGNIRLWKENEQVKAERDKAINIGIFCKEEIKLLTDQLAAKNEVLLEISANMGDPYDYPQMARSALSAYPPREKGADNE